MARVTVIAIVEMEYETGDRSSRAWIEGDVMSGILKDVKTAFEKEPEALKEAGHSQLVSYKTTIASPV